MASGWVMVPGRCSPQREAEPDFRQLNAGKLIEQLPGSRRGGAGFEFVLKTHPEAVSQEGDHGMGFDSLGVECRIGRMAIASVTDDGFNLGKLNVLAPEFPDHSPTKFVRNNRLRPARGQAQFVAIPPAA